MRTRCLSTLVLLASLAPAWGADWTAWRGPADTGYVPEKAAVTSWSMSGENLLWKSPVGGRTTPIVMNGRVFLNAPVGENPNLQERVACLDANTGKLLWEHRFNVFLTTIVEDRVGWSAMVGDPETNLVYVHGTGGEMICLTMDGDVKWKVSMTEMFGRISGYGGRLHTPIIDGDRLIITFSNSSWGPLGKPLHRLLAMDKMTGAAKWWAAPGGIPIDKTCYSTPAVSVIGGRKQLVGGNGDGWVYGMDADTGETLWKFQMSKRGLNASVAIQGDYVYAAHGEENLAITEMGAIVCIDATRRGDITSSGAVWRANGLTVGYASPGIANGRVYVVDNSANLHALDAKTGQAYWEFNFGRVGKASPVITADGIIYILGQNGSFHILKDEGERCVSLDKQEFTREDGLVDEAFGSAAVVDGRVYFQTRYGTYCLGNKDARPETVSLPASPKLDPAQYAERRHIRVVPADVTLMSSNTQQFHVEQIQGIDTQIDPAGVSWSVQGIGGSVSDSGLLSASGDTFAAGHVVARIGDQTAKARVRFAPNGALKMDFENVALGKVPAGWIGVGSKTEVVERDGSRVLKKLAVKPSVPFMRIRGYMTEPLAGGYTVQADMLGAPKKRFMPDMGLINSRYTFMMRGGAQKLRIVSWSPEPRIQKDVPFRWQVDKWYTAKFEVQVREQDALVRAKVWPRGESEPDAWNIELTDPCPNREGSPGIYGFSTGTTAKSKGTEIFYDNIQVIQ